MYYNRDKEERVIETSERDEMRREKIVGGEGRKEGGGGVEGRST